MNPVLIFESGIHTWERTAPTSHCRFATLSVIASSFEGLLPILNAILPTLDGKLTHWFRWHTAGRVFEGNGIQKRNMLGALGRDIGNFKQPIVRSSENIFTSTSKFFMPISVLELDTLSSYKRELLIGTRDQDLTAENLSSLMAPLAKRDDPKCLASLLESKDDLIVGRLFRDVDTHCVFQWFGTEADLRLLKATLVRMNIGLLISRNEVANLF